MQEVGNEPAETGHSRPDRAEVWSAYWGQGPLHSLPTSFPDNYQGQIRDFWVGMLSGLGTGHRMLDIGTGNGALPRMALELRGVNCPQVDAIDAAAVAPAWHAKLSVKSARRIRFHGHVQAESLPFPDQYFDLATSQYGFEYTDIPAAAAQAHRVLRSGGRLGLVLHHAGSKLHAVAVEEAEAAAFVSGADGFLERAMRLLPWLAMAARGWIAQLNATPAARQDRADFNASAAALAARIEAGRGAGLLADVRDYAFGVVQAVQRRQLDEDGARAHLASYLETVSQAQVRSAELCEHALSPEGMERLRNTLSGAGFGDLRTSTLYHDGMLIAWSLQAARG